MGVWVEVSFLLALLQMLIFWGLGGACFGVTLDTYIDHEYAFFLSKTLDLLFDKSGWFLMVGGMILVVIALFLPFTICFESKGLYIACAVIQGVVGLVLLIGGILAAATRLQMRGEDMHQLGVEMTNLITTHYGRERDAWDFKFTRHWNRLQQRERCCAPQEGQWHTFRTSPWYYNQDGEELLSPDAPRPLVPVSCCFYNLRYEILKLQKCQTYQDGPPKLNGGTNEYLYHRGCEQAYRDFVWHYTRIFMALGIGSGLICLVSMALPILIMLRKPVDEDAGKTHMLGIGMSQTSMGSAGRGQLPRSSRA